MLWPPAAPVPPPPLPLAAQPPPPVPIPLAGTLPPAALAMGRPARPPTRTAAAVDPRLLALLPPDLRPLAADLQSHGFRLRLGPPPVPGAYGQYVPASRSLWLAPIAFDLGIGRTTFLHEAVHAVQSCPGGTLTPIGWKLRLEPVVAQEIGGILSQRYHHGNRLLEQEAFALQGQADAVPRLRAALRQRCPAPG